MTAGFLYFAFSLLLLSNTLFLLYPGMYGRELQPILSIPPMLVALFIPHTVVLGLLLTALFAWGGALGTTLGQIGLLVHLGCWVVLLGYLRRMAAAHPSLDGQPVRDEDHPFGAALDEERRGRLRPGRLDWRQSVLLRIPALAEVDVVRNVIYREVDGVRLRLDVYRPRRRSGPLPAALYIHGGAWITGNRRQSTFMMYELAAAGWVVFAISYRRAPRFPLPAAIEDSKAALAWIREHGLEYGTRGDEVVVLGGSAGGHLAAMLALTPSDPRFQPGFEAADTRVRGAVMFYGFFDFEQVIAEEQHRAATLFFQRYIFHKSFADQPELYRQAAPMSYLGGDRAAPVPPMLLVHGTRDALVPIDQSRRFYRKLKEAGGQQVHLLEMPMAVHAFEIIPTPLHQRSLRVILQFMETLRPGGQGRDLSREPGAPVTDPSPGATPTQA